jgi:hypothetical protein
MPTWEYRKIDLDASPHAMSDVELLNAAGKEGWEVVHVTDNNAAYLKRAREEADHPAKNGRQDKGTTDVRA